MDTITNLEISPVRGVSNKGHIVWSCLFDYITHNPKAKNAEKTKLVKLFRETALMEFFSGNKKFDGHIIREEFRFLFKELILLTEEDDKYLLALDIIVIPQRSFHLPFVLGVGDAKNVRSSAAINFFIESIPLLESTDNLTSHVGNLFIKNLLAKRLISLFRQSENCADEKYKEAIKYFSQLAGDKKFAE